MKHENAGVGGGGVWGRDGMEDVIGGCPAAGSTFMHVRTWYLWCSAWTGCLLRTSHTRTEPSSLPDAKRWPPLAAGMATLLTQPLCSAHLRIRFPTFASHTATVLSADAETI
jgi:hypothetical protein